MACLRKEPGRRRLCLRGPAARSERRLPCRAALPAPRLRARRTPRRSRAQRRRRADRRRARRTPSITQSTMRRPRIGWRCFGTSERIRVPRPAAITTAPSVLSSLDGTEAGAPGFEPGITGPKPVALPLGHAPERASSCQSWQIVSVERPRDQRAARALEQRLPPNRRRPRTRRARTPSGLLLRHPRGMRRLRSARRESDDDARSFAGSVASSRGVLVAASASRRLSARSSKPSAPPRSSNAA